VPSGALITPIVFDAIYLAAKDVYVGVGKGQALKSGWEHPLILA